MMSEKIDSDNDGEMGNNNVTQDHHQICSSKRQALALQKIGSLFGKDIKDSKKMKRALRELNVMKVRINMKITYFINYMILIFLHELLFERKNLSIFYYTYIDIQYTELKLDIKFLDEGHFHFEKKKSFKFYRKQSKGEL